MWEYTLLDEVVTEDGELEDGWKGGQTRETMLVVEEAKGDEESRGRGEGEEVRESKLAVWSYWNGS